MRKVYLVLAVLLIVLVVAVLVAQAEPEMAVQVYFPVSINARCIIVPPETCAWCVPERCYWVSW